MHTPQWHDTWHGSDPTNPAVYFPSSSSSASTSSGLFSPLPPPLIGVGVGVGTSTPNFLQPMMGSPLGMMTVPHQSYDYNSIQLSPNVYTTTSPHSSDGSSGGETHSSEEEASPIDTNIKQQQQHDEPPPPSSSYVKLEHGISTLESSLPPAHSSSSVTNTPRRNQTKHAHLSVKTESNDNNNLNTHPHHQSQPPSHPPVSSDPPRFSVSVGLTPQQQAAALAEQQAHRAAEVANCGGGDDDDDDDGGHGSGGGNGSNNHLTTSGGGVGSDSKMKRGHGSSCHQCLTGDTAITLNDGFSRPITDVAVGTHVLSLDKVSTAGRTEVGFVTKATSALLKQGVKECVELLFSDGRTITSTHDHRFRTADGQWITAEDMTVGITDITAGMEYPHLAPLVDADAAWELDLTDSLGFKLNVRDGLGRSLAFAGLLGYLLTADRTSEDGSVLYPGHPLDAQAIVRDIHLLTGTAPTASRCNAVWTIHFPAQLHEAMLAVGASAADRLETSTHFPAFLMSPTCPLAVLQAFIGGLFGGGGKAPSLAWEGNQAQFAEIRFSLTHKGSVQIDQTRVTTEETQSLMMRCGISKEALGERLSSNATSGVDPNASDSIEWSISTSATLSFARSVGFRYCCHKQMRLTAACAYYRLAETLSRQKKLISDAILAEEAACGGRPFVGGDSDHSQLMTCIEEAKAQLAKQENVHPDIMAWKPTELKDAKQMGMDIHAALHSFDALKFFSPADTDMAVYGIDSEVVLPTFRVRLIGKREAGSKATFDLSVPETENFLANGLTVHNCKTTKDPQFLFFCTNKAEKGVRKRRCRKKYCDSCLKRSYGNDASEIIPSWQCPSCLGVCICAACHRKSSRKSGGGGVIVPAGSNIESVTSTNVTVPTSNPQGVDAIRKAERHTQGSHLHSSIEHGSSSSSLTIPPTGRSTSNTSVRVSLSPLTISRTESQDSVAPPPPIVLKTERSRSCVGEQIRLSPRFSSRSPLTGKGNSSSSNNLVGLIDLNLPGPLDPYVPTTHNDELERLMVDMNMAQRQAFLHDAINLNPNKLHHHPQLQQHHHHSASSSPRGSPRSMKRKLGVASGPSGRCSPSIRIKTSSHAVVDELVSTTTNLLPPSHHSSSHTPSKRATFTGGMKSLFDPLTTTTSSASTTTTGTTPSSSNHLSSLSPNLLPLSTPSLATHLPVDDFLDGSNNGVGDMFSSPPPSLFSPIGTSSNTVSSSSSTTTSSTSTTDSTIELPPQGQFDWKTNFSSSKDEDLTSSSNETNIKSETDYLEWSNQTPSGVPSSSSSSSASSAASASSSTSHHHVVSQLPASFLSPLPGTLMLNFPITPGTSVAASSVSTSVSTMMLMSPNPMMQSTPNPMTTNHHHHQQQQHHHFGVTPSGYSTSSSSLFSPNPASNASPISISTPNHYGSAMVYPSTYILPSSDSVVSTFRQLSVGGTNVLMGDAGLLERGMSALDSNLGCGIVNMVGVGGGSGGGGNGSGVITLNETSQDGISSIEGMWNSDENVWRQTTMNVNTNNGNNTTVEAN